VLIGRGDVAVPDPFQPYRHGLGHAYARQIDAEAVLLGDELALLSDKKLASRAVSLRAAFAWLDYEVIKDTRSWDAALRDVRARYAMAEEGLAMLETLVRQRPDAEDLLNETLVRQRPDTDDLLKRWEEQMALVDRLEIALIGLSEAHKTSGRTVHAKLWPRREGIAKAVAVAREQAIRAAERERQPRAAEPSGSPANVRQVGTGAATRARESARAERLAREHARRHAEVVTREDVAAPRAVDQLRPLIGESRALELERRMRSMQPLADWVEHGDEAWVRRRHAELGKASRMLDRGAARRARIAEVRHETEQAERAQAWRDAKRFRDSHPEVADVVSEWADDTIEPRERSRNYLDAWMEQDLDRVVKALIFQDELETRRHLEAMRKVEDSVVDPPERLRTLIGDGLDLGEDGRKEWEALARELEGERLLRESAAREGLKHRGPKPKERRALEARVERFRAVAGLESPAAQEREAPVEAEGAGMG
jgi:hypothetical protein